MPQARVTFEHGHAKNRRVCHFRPARRGAMTGSAAAPASSSTKRLMTADRHVLRVSSLALCNDFRGSVPRDERSAEAVVDARGDHVDILTDALAMIEHRAECRVIGHRDVAISHATDDRCGIECCAPWATSATIQAGVRRARAIIKSTAPYPSSRTRWGRPLPPSG